MRDEIRHGINPSISFGCDCCATARRKRDVACCAGFWTLATREASRAPNGRRPKSAKARSREKDDEFTRVAQPDKLAPSGSGIGSSNSRLQAIP